jgi:HK97 family phage major capsid protein
MSGDIIDRLQRSTDALEAAAAAVEVDRKRAKAEEALSTFGYQQDANGEWRTASKAHLFAGGGPTYQSTTEGGEFLLAVMQARSKDAEEQAIGKAALEGLARYVKGDPAKATLGTTDATGGWIVPNGLVDNLVKPPRIQNPYRELMTWRSGVNSATIDIPLRSASPARAVIAAWGDTKENVNLAYNGYTATAYTLARIYDLAKQFVRTSAGAAEQDVMSELGTAIALGEAYYLRDGTGSSMPYGFIPALTNGPSTYRTTHTAAANTVAGSVAAAIAKAAGALVGRGYKPEAAVISADGFVEMMTNGADTAGFFLSGISGPQSLPGFRAGTLVSPWGIPVIVDPGFASDDLVVAEWSVFKAYTDDSYRVDVSDVAGDRWDKNLVGFRGEETLAYDARPAVYAGAAQYVTDILS